MDHSVPLHYERAYAATLLERMADKALSPFVGGQPGDLEAAAWDEHVSHIRAALPYLLDPEAAPQPSGDTLRFVVRLLRLSSSLAVRHALNVEILLEDAHWDAHTIVAAHVADWLEAQARH